MTGNNEAFCSKYWKRTDIGSCKNTKKKKHLAPDVRKIKPLTRIFAASVEPGNDAEASS
jgi:hypothetical protein